MSRPSLLIRYELFVACAVLTAHVNGRGLFRQHDVRFMIEVFTNWVEASEAASSLQVQNTQVARYLETLVDEGFARKLLKSSFPEYRLTRIGLLEMLSRIVERERVQQREHFYFVYYFIQTYRDQLIKIVKREGSKFPFALQAELDELLDIDVLLKREIELTRLALRKLDRRIEEARQTKQSVEQLLEDEIPYDHILSELERRAPLDILTARSYSELYARVTERQGVWEMTQGNASRVERLWEPSRFLLACHLKEIERLQALTEAKSDSLP